MDVGAAPITPVLAAGRFEVRGTLGAGGAGVVYRAFDRQLQREVALKLLREASGRDLYRFKREFRALAGIVHPNLVALHELHSVDGDWYFTMELVEGMSWLDWVRPGKPGRTRAELTTASLDETRLRASLVQLVDALVALHDAGKLHRDLKPSNVLVSASGRVTLLDFGLVATVAEANPERLAVGTPVYMSPEQAADQPLTGASDWYSVGAMLYEALTGRRPFEGDSEQVMTRKQTEVPAHPVQLAPVIPMDLARLAMALLEAAPGARPAGLDVLNRLGAAPSRRTRDLARLAAPSMFVGREGELEQLAAALGDAHRRAVAVLVRGRSGIGKSTLVKQFLRGLGDAVFVLDGRCFEREAVPFKMLDGLVDTLTAVILGLTPDEQAALAPRELGSLMRLFPVLRRVPKLVELEQPPPVDLQELRRRGFQSLRTLLARLARLKPVVMFVDDAHWGDTDSAGFLAELIHGAEPSTLILISHRPEDYLGVVAQLKRVPGGSARRGDVRELEVAPLSADAAIALVAELADDSARAARIVAAGHGNPLILTELARGDEAELGTIDAMVRARVGRLSVEVQAMLSVVSIAARPIPIAIAAHAAGIVGGLDEATRLSAERLATVREVGDDMILHPAHDYVRIAILAGLDHETRAGWHEALAKAFEAVQGPDQLDSQAVVEHWLAAGHPANAATHAVTAAQRAEEALAFHRAAEQLYQIALTYGPWDSTGQRDLLRRKAQALTCAGQLDEAAQVYGHAAQLLPDSEAIDLERLRVEALLRRGRLDEALPLAEKLLAQVGIRIPLGHRASRTRLATQWMQMKLRGLDFSERDASTIPGDELLAVDVLYSISSGLAFTDPGLGRVVQSELIRSALDAGEPIRVCLALAQELAYAAAVGQRNRAAVDAVSARLRSVATRVGHPHVIGFADLAIGLAAHMHGRWPDARAELEAGLDKLREHGAGVRWEIDIGEAYWFATLFYLGEWREMARLTQLHLRDAIDRGDIVAQQGLRTGRTNLAWLVLDRPDEARAQLDAVEKALGPGFHIMHAQTAIAGAQLDVYRGDGDAAAARLAQAGPQLERVGLVRFEQARVELTHLRARIALLRGDREARELVDSLSGETAPWAAGLGQLGRAALLAFEGDLDGAIDPLNRAEELFAGAHMAGHLQVARMRRGVLEGGAIGIAHAAAARDALRDLGAVDPDSFSALLMPWPL